MKNNSFNKNQIHNLQNAQSDGLKLNAHRELKKLCKTSNGQGSLEEIRSDVVQIFNHSHSVVRVGSKTLICESTTDAKGLKVFEFSQVFQVRSFYSNLNYRYKQGNHSKEMNLFDLWMKDTERQDYYGVVFDPSNKVRHDYLNMWDGFEVNAIDGDNNFSHIRNHLFYVICNGSQENYNYLVAWLAHIIQKPEEKSGVMVALRSEERGTGKSTVSVLMEKIMGNHSIRVQDPKHLLGAFNHHLANKIFVTIEEAFWSGSDKDAGKLRTMVTESSMVLEAKGKDAITIDSFHRFLMCTNNDWTVPATKDERRYFVLDVLPSKVSNTQYFKELYDEINDPTAIGQFFNYLKNYDISKYNLRKAPATDALQEQIRQSMKPHEKWLESVLENEEIMTDGYSYSLFESTTEDYVPKSDCYASYIKRCNDLNITSYWRIDDKTFGKYLNKVLKPTSGRPRINGRRVSAYKFKSIVEMRKMFDEYYQYS